MEKWQILYLLIALGSFVVGWAIDPIAGVAFAWISIILSEIIHYQKEMQEFEKRSEEV